MYLYFTHNSKQKNQNIRLKIFHLMNTFYIFKILANVKHKMLKKVE